MERKKNDGEFQKQEPFTRIFVQEMTSANYVSIIRSNLRISDIQGICACAPTPGAALRFLEKGVMNKNDLLGSTSAPTPVVGNGCDDRLTPILTMAFDIEKSEYCQSTRTTGNPDLALAYAKFLQLNRIIADLEAERKATLEAMMDGPKDKSGNEVAADGGTAAQSHEEVALRSLPLKKGPYRDLPGSTSAQADNYEESRLEYQLPGNPDLALAHAKLSRIIADLEAERKATLEDKPGNEVAADGATFAQSPEGGELRSLPLEGMYEDLPVSTSTQAHNNEIVEKTLIERIGVWLRKVPNATVFIAYGSIGVYFLCQIASQVKMINEKADAVAYQVMMAILKDGKKVDEVANQLKAAEKKTDDLAKELKEACEKVGSKVDELLKAAYEVCQNIIASSPYTSHSSTNGLVNIEIGTNKGQGWRR